MAKVNKRIWIWTVLVILLFSVVSYVVSLKEPKHYDSYLSYSPAPSGVKALYTYLKQEQLHVDKWEQSPNLLPKDKKSLLIIEEPFINLDTNEIKSYERFMEEGNTILYMSDHPQDLFHINAYSIEGKDNQELSSIQGEGQRYKAEVPSIYRLQPKGTDKVIYSDSEGVIAFSRQVGKGQLIVCNSPDWMINDRILKDDHLPLVLHLLNRVHTENVLFDEYLHGQENATSVTALYPQWFLLFLLQAVMILVLWLWYKGKRFGMIIVPREEVVRFSDEKLQALAAWYIRGRRYRDSLHIQADYVKQLLQEKWGIPVQKEWKDVVHILELKWKSKSAREINEFVNELYNILRREKSINKKEYLSWSKLLDQLRKEVEEG